MDLPGAGRKLFARPGEGVVSELKLESLHLLNAFLGRFVFNSQITC